MINDEAIREFQKICLKKYGDKLPFEKAKEEALRLLQLFKLIYRPLEIKRDKNEKLGQDKTALEQIR